LVALSAGYDIDPKGRGRMILFEHYLRAVRAAGGIPVAVPPVASAEEAEEVLARLDGLLLIGGDDIDPRRFGQEKHPKAELMHPDREASDFALLSAADRLARPTFGICLGCQEINVSRGGTLHQHLPDVSTIRTKHSGPYPDRASHRVRVERGSALYSVLGAEDVTVNSAHHQGVDRLGAGLRVAAVSEDGLIEAMEGTEPGRFLLAVQWHPEEMHYHRPDMRALFERFVSACAESRRS
jgi:putative glutamine amidotransferase